MTEHLTVQSLTDELRAHIETERVHDIGIDDKLAQIQRNTEEIVEAWKNAKGALRVFALIGEFAKWVTAILTTIGAVYWLLKDR